MKALNKDIIREIKNSKGRIISIMLMVTIGVLILIGLKITSPIMERRADEYFVKTKGADIILSSTFGLDDKDLDIVKNIPDLKDYEVGYNFDVETKKNDDLIRLNSLTTKVSTVELESGRLPKGEDEIILDKQLKNKYKIDDIIEFQKENIEEDEEYSLKNYEYRVVGFATSPEYVDSINLGSSSIGDGIISGFAFINKENFNSELYSSIKMTFKDLENFKYSGEDYRKIAKKHKNELEDSLVFRKDEVFSEKKAEIVKEISDGEKELNDAKDKIRDAEKEIEDGKKKISDGYREFNKGKNKLNSEISKGRRELENGQRELNKNKKLLDSKREEISKGEKELKDAKSKMDLGRVELDKAWKEYYDNEKLLNNGISKINLEIDKMNSSIDEIDNVINSIPEMKKQLIYLQGQVEELKGQGKKINDGLAVIKGNISIINDQIAFIEGQLENGPNEELEGQLTILKEQKNNLTVEEGNLQNNLNKIYSGIREVEENITKIQSLINSESSLIENREKIKQGIITANGEKEKLLENLEKLQEGKTQLNKEEDNWQKGNKKYLLSLEEFNKGKAEFEKGEKEIISGQKKIDDGFKELKSAEKKGNDKLNSALKEIEDGEKTLKENEEKFLEEKEKAEKEIADGEEKLDDARRILNILQSPKYNVETRESNNSIYTFYDEAKRLQIISNIFPVFFFFIALLVSLTTMTRMVDEQRLEIGTIKALGYSNTQIMKKYFIYGGVASVLGSILGILLGHKLISPLIFSAYSSNYVFETTNIPFNTNYSIVALIIGVLCTAVAGAMATWGSLRDNSATLMRGKPPRSGNRIFLERVKPIWKRLSFMQKVTMRNLFRYKKRMFMTIIGIAGCTGLVFMGFGIKDSIINMEKKQYHEIFDYDLISIYDEEYSLTGYEEYNDLMENTDKIKDHSKVLVSSVNAEGENGPDQIITLISPENDEEFSKFIELRSRKDKKNIELKDGGAVLSEKISKLLNVKAGDKITVKDGDNKNIEIKIDAIVENYAGHYIYLSPNYYEEVFGEEYEPNGDIVNINFTEKEEKSEIIEEINNNDSVLSIYNNNQLKEMIDGLLGTLDILVFVIISCSCILAFVVLYNLTNINVSERIRELSTIKVLGFYDREVTAYVYRETYMLTIVGIFFGYLIGFIMHYIIINNLVPDMAMLDPHLYLTNYILSAVITMVFATMVMVVVHRKLKRINMVEALKAVE